MSKKFDKLCNLLAMLNCHFSFNGISKTKSILDGELLLEFSLSRITLLYLAMKIVNSH